MKTKQIRPSSIAISRKNLDRLKVLCAANKFYILPVNDLIYENLLHLWGDDPELFADWIYAIENELNVDKDLRAN